MSGKGKNLNVEMMKAEIKAGFKDLGVEINFDPDRVLTTYRRGPPLKLGELKSKPDGAVVWVWYKQHDEEGPRINHAMRITRADDAWGLDDGSSFAAEFTPTGDYNSTTGEFATPSDDSECFDEGCGEGEMFLYHAVIPERKTPKKGRRR